MASQQKLKETIEASAKTSREILRSPKIYLSLLSQSSNHVNIEIICDPNKLLKETTEGDCPGVSNDSIRNEKEDTVLLNKIVDETPPDIEAERRASEKIFLNRLERASLEYFINISSKNDLKTTSEVGWINKSQLIMTLNNKYMLINLKQKDMAIARSGPREKHCILYGI